METYTSKDAKGNKLAKGDFVRYLGNSMFSDRGGVEGSTYTISEVWDKATDAIDLAGFIRGGYNSGCFEKTNPSVMFDVEYTVTVTTKCRVTSADPAKLLADLRKDPLLVVSNFVATAK